MPLARPTFLRVHVADGSHSSRCTWCVRSIATAYNEAELQAVELQHECDHDDLQRFARTATKQTRRPTAFQVWVTERNEGAAS